MPISFDDVISIMKDIAAQLSSNTDTYEQCNIRFERSASLVLLAVDVLNPLFEIIELTVSKKVDDKKISWFINGEPVEETCITYGNLIDRFRHLNLGVYNTLVYLHREGKRGTNWTIEYDKTRNLIVIIDKTTGAFLFKVTFTPYNRLNENTELMVCFSDSQTYEKFKSYGQLITALYSKHIIKIQQKLGPFIIKRQDVATRVTNSTRC